MNNVQHHAGTKKTPNETTETTAITNKFVNKLFSPPVITTSSCRGHDNIPRAKTAYQAIREQQQH